MKGLVEKEKAARWVAQSDDRMLKVVAYVDPPGLTDGHTTVAESWSSAAVDKLKGMPEIGCSGRVEEVTFDEVMGPVVVIEVPAGEFFGKPFWDGEVLCCEGLAVCSLVEYYPKEVGPYHLVICDNVQVSEIEFRRRGCNPHSHVFVPRSPFGFGGQHPEFRQPGFFHPGDRHIPSDIRITQKKVDKWFPDVDFRGNMILNELVKPELLSKGGGRTLQLR